MMKIVFLYIVLFPFHCSCLTTIILQTNNFFYPNQIFQKLEIEAAQGTEFGREALLFIDSQETEYVKDYKMPAEAAYRKHDDKIHYHPSKVVKKHNTLIKNYLVGDIPTLALQVHEEIHRVQTLSGDDGKFFSVFRQYGTINLVLMADGNKKYDFEYAGTQKNLYKMYKQITGQKEQDIHIVQKQLGVYIDKFGKADPEKTLLKELQSFLSIPVFDYQELFRIMFIRLKDTYGWLPQLPIKEFSTLCEQVEMVYGYFGADHRKMAQFIGKQNSLEDFKRSFFEIEKKVGKKRLNENKTSFIRKKTNLAESVKTFAVKYLK